MSRRLDIGLAATGLLTTSGASALAADVVLPTPWGRTYSAAVNAGIRFGGSGGPRFILGFEGTGAYIEDPNRCGGAAQTYIGAIARIEGAFGEGTRLLLGPVFGRTSGTSGYAADLGLGHAFGRNAGFVAAAGVTGSLAYFLETRVAVSSLLDGQAAGALRYPPLTTSGSCVVGRPLRRDDGRAPLAGATRIRRRRTEDAARERAGQVWLDRARMEWASVPAFLELVRQLTALGAPLELIERARAAAADELRHAVLSGDLAATLGELHLVDLDPPAVTPPRSPAFGRAGLIRLAVESFVDGCVGEAAAADQAEREAELATSPPIAAVLRTIAGDEAGHARLAWDVVTWALGADGAAVRPALHDAASAAPEVVAASSPAMPAFGILDGEATFALHVNGHARAFDRLRAALG